MKNKEKQTISEALAAERTPADSPATRSYNDSRDGRTFSPPETSARSPVKPKAKSSVEYREKQTISDALAAEQASVDSSPNRTYNDRRDGNPFSPPGTSARSPVDSTKKKTISDALAAEQASSDSSPNRAYNDSRDGNPPPVDSTARSSVSPIGSSESSLSHGSSPREEENPTENPPRKAPEKPLSPQAGVYRSVRDEPVAVTKKDPEVGEGFTGGVVENGGGGKRRLRPPISILRRTKRDAMVKRSALGFRVFAMLFCLVSFAVMAADRNKGWALDSFLNYKEFRYSMSVNVIGFLYSGAQACDLVYHLATGKYVSGHPLRYYLDFSLDQMLTYLLISASSSAATRVDDWISNWGKDKFPDMASASVAMSFLAFLASASSSLISGYVLCTFRST